MYYKLYNRSASLYDSQVMTATFLILGHKAKEIKQWPQMVVLMGKTGKLGLKRRVQSYDPDNMPWEVAVACNEILVGMDVGMVADVSAGAAAFFVWVSDRLPILQHVTDFPIFKILKRLHNQDIALRADHTSITIGST